MTTTATTPSNATTDTMTSPKEGGLAQTVLDLGFAWATYGLKLGTSALTESAKALELTAKTLERLSNEFAQKSRTKAETAEAAK
ncbi:MAG: hypothetical protein ABI551_26960 [Polyangiaceae bacterium]